VDEHGTGINGAGEYDLSPRQFMGKKLYEKYEPYRAIHGSGSWR